MYIGEASKASGATIKTIRFYEKLGLLPNIARVNSYRVFTEEDILLIKFIKMAQKLDFKLSELKEIIYPKEGAISWEKIRKAIEIKEIKIAKDILKLQKNKSQLRSYNQEIIQCVKNNEDCLFPKTKN